MKYLEGDQTEVLNHWYLSITQGRDMLDRVLSTHDKSNFSFSKNIIEGHEVLTFVSYTNDNEPQPLAKFKVVRTYQDNSDNPLYYPLCVTVWTKKSKARIAVTSSVINPNGRITTFSQKHKLVQGTIEDLLFRIFNDKKYKWKI